MDELDFVDEITMIIENFECMFDILQMNIIKLDNDTLESAERDKIIKCISLFCFILQIMKNEKENIRQKCNDYVKTLQKK